MRFLRSVNAALGSRPSFDCRVGHRLLGVTNLVASGSDAAAGPL